DRSNNSAEFRKYVIGVVTHGLVLSGTFPEWATQMKNALYAIGYDDVITLDWVVASTSRSPGQAIVAGERRAGMLGADLLRLSVLGPVDIHFIGHSRGAIVNTEALQAVASSGVIANLRDGFIKMTYLDPHPANLNQFDSDHSASADLLGSGATDVLRSF